jgi:hypothetical protein
MEAAIALSGRLQRLDNALRLAGKEAAESSPHPRSRRFANRPLVGLALACSACFIWSRSGITNSFDRKRAPAGGALAPVKLHCDDGNGVLSKQ